MTQLADTNTYPKVLELPRFRSAVREHLVTLGNESPGLGLMITGLLHAALVVPRAGRSLTSREDLLRLKWLHANLEGDKNDPQITITEMADPAVENFLALIGPIPR